MEMTVDQSGWKPIPMALKILSVLMLLWAVGTVMNLPNLMTNGLPLLGNFVFGSTAVTVALFLDFVGPFVFLYGLWNRKPWAPKWALFYIGLFVLNGFVALFTVSDQLGMPQILVPNIVSLLFLAVIYWKRDYFSKT